MTLPLAAESPTLGTPLGSPLPLHLPQLWGDPGADTLTGGTGADLIVLRSGGGNDLVTDFSAAEGDRIALQPGVGWTAAEGGDGAVVTLSDGGTVTLRGLAAADVTAGLFVTQ